MKKKICSILTILMIALMTTNVFAATVSSEKAILSIVDQSVCKINILEKAFFEKKITNYDLSKKEVTIGLTVKNDAIPPLDKPCEIVLLIDNSNSMVSNTTSLGDTRMECVDNSAKQLATSLLALDTIKISVVSFSSASPSDPSTPNNTIPYTDPLYVPEGNLNDALVRTPLTNSKNAIFEAIDSIENTNKGIRTDIDAGLTLASQQFSGTCESQIIVLLTDGVPNLSIGLQDSRYNIEDIENTKNTLLRLSNSGIRILSMMTGLKTEIVDLFPRGASLADASGSEAVSNKDICEAIFGTPSKPTVGKFYNVTDDDIEETISKTILEDLKAVDTEILTDLVITDSIPSSIIENFDVEIVQEPTVGTAEIGQSTIQWSINRLSYGESASMSYKLKLKEKINESISGVVLNTNDGVDIISEHILDDDGNSKIFTSKVTPKIKVVISPDPTPTPTPTPTPDDTIAPDSLPNTGVTLTVTAFIIITLLYCIITRVRIDKLRKY